MGLAWVSGLCGSVDSIFCRGGPDTFLIGNIFTSFSGIYRPVRSVQISAYPRSEKVKVNTNFGYLNCADNKQYQPTSDDFVSLSCLFRGDKPCRTPVIMF